MAVTTTLSTNGAATMKGVTIRKPGHLRVPYLVINYVSLARIPKSTLTIFVVLALQQH
jgi:hypothetical protein